MELEGSVVVVTGAASGIGLAADRLGAQRQDVLGPSEPRIVRWQ